MLAPKKVIEELAEIFEPHSLSRKNIKPAQIEILQHLCEHPGSTVYEIHRKRALGKYIDIRTLRRYIGDLAEKRLIERPDGNAEHKAKPCKVTIIGIVYLILTRNILYKSIIKKIFENYGNNALFKLILYPYIEQDTLKQLRSFNSLSPVSLFLYECCRDIEGVLMSRRNGRAAEQVFFWQAVPRNTNETNRLRHFLKQELNLGWVNHTNDKDFRKTDNDNKLIISHGPDFISISLDDKKTKATLMEKGKKLYEFIVETGANSLLIIGAPTKSAEEFLASSLSFSIREHITSLVFSLISHVEQNSPDFLILSQGKKFMRTSKEAKMKFDKKYETIAR